MKLYQVWEAGFLVGILELSPEQVRRFTAEADYVLIPLPEC